MNQLPADWATRGPARFPPPFASAWGDDQHGLWADLHVPAGGGPDQAVQRFRWIEPGRFMMGSPENEPGRQDREGPQHLVTLTSGFWLGATACTQALWRAVMGGDPSHFKGDDRPVEQVSWRDVQRFLRALEALVPDCHADLPTEAEWEYACRAGTVTPFSFGDNVTTDQVNYSGKETVPVGSQPANPWGLHEMHGNVWEWCADGLRNYKADAAVDPRGLEDSGERALRASRGGSWISGARRARSAIRGASRSGGAIRPLGFRLCLRSIESSQWRPGGPSEDPPRDEADRGRGSSITESLWRRLSRHK